MGYRRAGIGDVLAPSIPATGPMPVSFESTVPGNIAVAVFLLPALIVRKIAPAALADDNWGIKSEILSGAAWIGLLLFFSFGSSGGRSR